MSFDGEAAGTSVGEDDPHGVEWTFKLEDGICTDSMALMTAKRFGLPGSIILRAREFAENLADDASPTEPRISGSFGTSQQSLSAAGSEPCPVSAPPGDEAVRGVTALLQSITGSAPVSVPPGWGCPPAFEGRACVYVLEVPGEERGGNDQAKKAVHYYVGETEALAQRIEFHRGRSENALGWKLLTAVVCPVDGGKSEARRVESYMIKKLVGNGLKLISTADGAHLHFARGEST